MRLWHKELIPVLPREQLVAQWRECSAIAGAIIKNGRPNHILINKVMDYDYEHFISYAKLVRDEMTRRGYRTTETVWNKIASLKVENYEPLEQEQLYSEWHNKEYMAICYWNLREKYLCSGISENDWNKIKTKVINYLYPWEDENSWGDIE